MSSKNLTKAKVGKNDEFYTRMEDIKAELSHYKESLAGKVVYCNCDDPYKSNFVKYFADNFHEIGIKRLIATCYKDQQKDLFSEEDIEPATCLIYDGQYDDFRNFIKALDGDGDFRSGECVRLLEECDIVITNPPFSLLREFIPLVISKGKEYIVIANQNILTSKVIFPLLLSGEVSFGYGFKGGFAFFHNEHYENYASASQKMDGMIRVPGVCWLTNIERKIKPIVHMAKSYSDEDNPKYDNYDAVDVKDINSIPYDYDGVMGVPITFMERYNETQFEIIGLNCVKDGEVYSNTKAVLKGETLYHRVMIRKRNPFQVQD